MNTGTIVGLLLFGLLAAIGLAALLRRGRAGRDPDADAEHLREDARRFARLLAAEIKLYNERHVAEGRLHHDLYTRLRTEIDQARARYEKRVNWLVVDGDYFHDAIVAFLCDGNAEVLGVEYPGPRTHAVQ